MPKFVDANVIIKAFTENDNKIECRNILYDEFITDTLCLIEAHYMIAKIKNNKIYAAECVRSIFKGNGTIIEIDRNILFEAIKKVEKYDLNIFDLVHYIIALRNECSEFVSYDDDFSGLEIKRTEP